MTDTEFNQDENKNQEPVVDGYFHLKVSSDQLTVYIDELRGPAGGGRPITADQIHGKLKDMDVKYGIDDNKINEILTLLNEHRLPDIEKYTAQKKQDNNPFCIVSGDAPVHGKNASLRWLIDEQQAQGYVVLPGELIAIYTPSRKGTAGKNIFGKTLTARQSGDDTLKAGGGIDQVTVGAEIEYRAKWFGIIHLKDHTIAVNCPLKTSDDKMSAILELHSPSSKNQVLELEHITKTLEACGIKYGIDEAAISDALAPGNNMAPATEVWVAHGRPPKDGIAAYIVYSRKEDVAGQELSKGRIDFHEHNYPWSFNKGDIIGHVIKAKAEEDGSNIWGEPIKAIRAKELQLQLEGAHIDSHNKIIADVDGTLIINGLHLRLVDLLVINGDVAHKTGNVHSIADIHVKGHVEPGFEIESQKSIVIDKNVEDANVRSGGSITIKGGIRGLKSEVYAPGEVRAGFIENAAVFVNGNVTITGSVINSKVSSNNAISVGSKQSKHSAIIGGRITARTNIETFVLGSSAFHKTIVCVGFTQEFKQQQRDLKKNIEKKESEYTRLEQIETHYKLHPKPDADEVMRKLNSSRELISNELASLKEQLNNVMEQIKQSENGHIVIHKKVFPGVMIKINEYTYEVNREMGAGIFTLENKEIVFRSG